MTRSSPVGAKALIPNPALQPLLFLIGDWRTIGTHPMLPGVTLEGRTSFAWHEGGAFLIMHSEVDHEGFPDGVAIVGSSDVTGRLAMNYFDERGTSRLMTVTADGEAVTWSRDDPDFAQSLTIRREGERLVSTGRMKPPSEDWGDDLSQTFVRA